MAELLRKSHCYTERRVTARKVHWCDWCGLPIKVGTAYVLATEFPGGEAGYADYAGRPVRFTVHAAPPCSYAPESGGSDRA